MKSTAIVGPSNLPIVESCRRDGIWNSLSIFQTHIAHPCSHHFSDDGFCYDDDEGSKLESLSHLIGLHNYVVSPSTGSILCICLETVQRTPMVEIGARHGAQPRARGSTRRSHSDG